MDDEIINKLIQREAPKIIQSMRDGLLMLSEDLKIVFANSAFYENFKVAPDETIGRYIYDLGNGQWNIPALRDLLEKTLSNDQEFHEFKIRHDFPNIGLKVMLLNGIKIKANGYMTLLVISDITNMEKVHQALKESFETLEKMNKYMVGRENKMVELKSEIADLKEKLMAALKVVKE